MLNYHPQMGRKGTKVSPPFWAARFDAMRKDNGVDIEKLSGLLGKTPAGVRHWLNGHRQITLQQFLDLCGYARVDPVNVLFGMRYVPVEAWEKIQGAAKTLLDAQPMPYKPKRARAS